MEAVEPIRHKSDIEKMKRLFRQKSLRDYALFTLGINTGLRISDLLVLTVGDVLAGKGSRVRIADKLTLREIKTRKRRNIMLNETVRSALALYLRTRERRYPEDPLFHMLLNDGSLELPTTREKQKQLENDPMKKPGKTGSAKEEPAETAEMPAPKEADASGAKAKK